MVSSSTIARGWSFEVLAEAIAYLPFRATSTKPAVRLKRRAKTGGRSRPRREVPDLPEPGQKRSTRSRRVPARGCMRLDHLFRVTDAVASGFWQMTWIPRSSAASVICLCEFRRSGDIDDIESAILHHGHRFLAGHGCRIALPVLAARARSRSQTATTSTPGTSRQPRAGRAQSNRTRPADAKGHRSSVCAPDRRGRHPGIPTPASSLRP